MKEACCSISRKVRKTNQHLTRNQSLKEDIFSSLADKIKGNVWLEGLFGIEKENIRVDKVGNLSQTPHPKVFGDKLTHPFITTDFSESQIEMRTPPLPDLDQTLGFLETVHDIISIELVDEYLWPQSIPPVLPEDSKIPIAQYDDEGKDAQKYREFLALKYGPKNQLFSGIHFNFSFSEKLLEMLYSKGKTGLTFDEFKDEAYLKTTRQLMRLRWMYVLLYGNSPVVDPSMELKCKHAPYKIDKHVIGLSIRNSCYGYQNLGALYPDYKSVQSYKQSIDKMVSDGILSSPKELYAPVRLKFIKTPDHISYIELRFIDIDPMAKAGITEDALHFLHALAVYGLLTEEPDLFEIKDQENANSYLEYVALYGLNPIPFIHKQSGKSIDVWAEIRQHIQYMSALFQKLSIDEPGYFKAIEHINELIESPKQRGVYEVLAGITKSGYIPFHLQQATTFLKQSQQKNYNFIGLEDMELSTQLLLREAVKRGVSFEILDRKENFIRFSHNGNIQYVKQATKTSLDNYASILAMENKLVTKKILDEAGIRIPKGMEYTEPEKAKSDYVFFEGKPIVIKPNQTNFGIGITILKQNIDKEVYNRAVDIAFEHDSTVLIEDFIEGKEFRFFVIGDEVTGILHRVPANVTGDGTLTIHELVQFKNQDPLRGKGYHTPLEKIQTGEAEVMFLASQQKDFDYIPSDGEIVFLRENSNISTGGDSIDFTDDIPDSYKQIAVKAAKALDVKITGLDMIIKDYKQDANSDNYAIIEMNFNPAIHIHCHPYKGKNRKLYEKIMDLLGYNQ